MCSTRGTGAIYYAVAVNQPGVDVGENIDILSPSHSPFFFVVAWLDPRERRKQNGQGMNRPGSIASRAFVCTTHEERILASPSSRQEWKGAFTGKHIMGRSRVVFGGVFLKGPLYCRYMYSSSRLHPEGGSFHCLTSCASTIYSSIGFDFHRLIQNLLLES